MPAGLAAFHKSMSYCDGCFQGLQIFKGLPRQKVSAQLSRGRFWRDVAKKAGTSGTASRKCPAKVQSLLLEASTRTG